MAARMYGMIFVKSMTKLTQFLANRFTALTLVLTLAILLGLSASAGAQPGNRVRVIIYTTLAPSPTGTGARLEYGYGKTAAQVDSVWSAMLTSHYFIGGLPIYSAYKVTGQDSARIGQGQFNTIARVDPQPASVVWPYQVAGALAGGSVSGGAVTGPYFKSEIIDLHGVWSIRDTVTGNRFITATSEPALPQFKFIASASDFPKSQFISSWLGSFTIGGKDSIVFDTITDSLRWYFDKNGVEFDSGTVFNVQGGSVYWAAETIPTPIAVNDTLSIRIWANHASSWDYRAAGLYIYPSLSAFPDSTDFVDFADSLWPMDTIKGAIPGYIYEQVLGGALSPLNQEFRADTFTVAPLAAPVFPMLVLNGLSSQAGAYTNDVAPFLAFWSPIRRYIRRTYITR